MDQDQKQSLGDQSELPRPRLERWSRWCNAADRIQRLGLLVAGLAAVLIVLLAITGFWTVTAGGVIGWVVQAMPWVLGAMFVGGVGVALPAIVLMVLATARIRGAEVKASTDYLPPLLGERFGDMRCSALEPELVVFSAVSPRWIRMFWRFALLLLSAIGIAVAVIGPFYTAGFWNAVKAVCVGLSTVVLIPFALSEFSSKWELRGAPDNRELSLWRSALGSADRRTRIPAARFRRVRASEGAFGFWTVEVEYADRAESGAELCGTSTLATFSTSKDHARWQAGRIAELVRRRMTDDLSKD